MVETTKNWDCGDRGSGAHRVMAVLPRFGDTLIDALMRSRMIEVLDIFLVI